MQQSGGLLLPPVQKLVATFISAFTAEMQIESLILFLLFPEAVPSKYISQEFFT